MYKNQQICYNAMHHDNEKKKESKYVNAANLFTQFHYLTLISPLASEERFLEDGDFPVIAFFAFTSDCLTFDMMLFDCF